MEIEDPQFRDAVAAIDAGDVTALQRRLTEHPRLVSERLSQGEGYFARPYLLWFVAENPVRHGTLPSNIADVARVLVQVARQARVDSLQEQIDGALALVCSGRVARECGAQGALIDAFVDAGARGDDALVSALAHGETAAARHLLSRGATPTLLAAVCLGSAQDMETPRRPDAPARMEELARAAGPAERQLALAGAALYGRADALALLVRLGVDVNAYGPRGFHPHATALHQAVNSGSLDAVKVLVEAGADLRARDHVYKGPPLGWAIYGKQAAIADYIRERLARQIVDALLDAGVLERAQGERAVALIAQRIDH